MSCDDEIPIYEVGTDVIIQELLQARPAQRGESGTPYVQENFSSITVSLFRIDEGTAYTVPGYDETALTISAVITDTLQDWDVDSRGYNFEHTIDADDLSSAGTYEVRYRFNLSGGGSFSTRREFLVRGPIDAPDFPFVGWHGAWSSSDSYVVGDVVQYLGSSWRAIDDNTNSTPPSTPSGSSTDWELVAAKGDTGAAGADGADGADGQDGVDGADGADGSDGATGATGPGYSANSTSNLAIGTGSKSFTTQSGLAYSVGARVRASYISDPSNWMEGLVTSYSGTTLVVDSALTNGSGTYNAWNLNVSGERGATGATGLTGSTGATGPGYTATSTTSLTIGTGFKTLSTQSGLAYVAGARVRIINTADTTEWMEGVISTYALTVLVVNVDLTSGAGTVATWTISLAGEPGDDGNDLSLQGEWDSGTTYDPFDVVEHEGSSYTATATNTNSEPPSANWQLLASAGVDGNDYEFNITKSPYSAVGDGTTDNTTGIQAALTAAAVVSAAGGRPVVFVPEGTFICEGVDCAGSYIKILGPGTLKLKSGSAQDCVLLVSGHYNQVSGITIDGNASSSPSGRGEGLRVTGNYNNVEGVISQTTKTTGSTGATFYLTSGGVGNTLRDCISISSGYTAFRIGSGFSKVRNCHAINHLSHGLGTTGQDMESLDVDGFYSTGGPSSTSFAGVLLDQGVSGTDGYMIRHASLRNIVVNSGAATYIPLKITRCHEVYLENVHAYHSATSSSLKIAEDIGKLVIKDSYFSRCIDQDESPNDPSGAITDPDGAGTGTAVSNNGGFAQFSSTGHGLKTNAYIVITGTTSYNGLHLVTAVTTGLFTTNRKFVTGSEAETGNFYSVVGDMTLDNVTIGDRTHNPAGSLSGIIAHRLKVDRCDFRGYTRFAIGLESNLAALSVYDRIEITNTRLESNHNEANSPWVVAWDTGFGTQGGQLLDSKVTRISNLEIVDVGTAASRGNRGNTERVQTLTASQTLTGLDSGKTFLIGAADLTITLPDVLVAGSGVKYTFVMLSAGLSSSTGLAISPQSGDYIALSLVSPGVNNKDLQLTGANDAVGDCVTLVSDSSLGWYAIDASGRWTIESDADVLGERKILITSSGSTLTPEQSGLVIIVAAADQTFTLPATVAGLRYTFFIGSGALSTGTGLSISPNSADRIFLAGISSADDKDIICSGATDRTGDSITIIGDGNQGWYVESVVGTWAREA